MQGNILKVKIIPHEGVERHLPKRGTGGSAGLDLFAAIAEPVTITHGQLVRIPTGIAICLAAQVAGFVYARSGLAVTHGIALSNGVGVIDSDYTGEIIVGLCNLSNEPYTILPQERIAQLVIMPIVTPQIMEVEILDDTERSAGGFGSTGKF